MNFYTINNFKKLDKFFYNILISNFASWRTYCISTLQFIKPHPEYFIKYKFFFHKSKIIFIILILRFFFGSFVRLFKWILRKIEDDFLNILNYTNNNFKEEQADIVIVTSLVNINTLHSRRNSNNDFIFGKIISHLKKRYKVKIIYLNLTRLNSKKVFNILKNNKEIYILNKILSFKNEVNIFTNQLIEFKNLTFSLSIKKLGLRNYILVLMNIFSFETRNNFRLTLQLKNILNKIKPSVVTLSYEGNCWEKSVFNICKNVQEGKCLSVGYQHAGVMDNQTIISHKYKDEFNPDFIITSGKNNMRYFNRLFGKKIKKKIFEIGSNRYVKEKKNKINKLKNIKFNNILVIPEGTHQETKILFDLSIKLAKKYSNKNFILRTHPQIDINSFSKTLYFFEKYKNLRNLIFSNKSFEHDLSRSDIVIYRGSTGVITAILKGVFPIYFRQINEYLNLDPIFILKKFRKHMYRVNNFEKVVKSLKFNEYHAAKNFCSNYFTPQKTSKTLNIFKQIMNYN